MEYEEFKKKLVNNIGKKKSEEILNNKSISLFQKILLNRWFILSLRISLIIIFLISYFINYQFLIDISLAVILANYIRYSISDDIKLQYKYLFNVISILLLILFFIYQYLPILGISIGIGQYFDTKKLFNK